MQQANRGSEAVAKAKLEGDYVVLGVTFVVLFLITSAYFVISFFQSQATQLVDPLEILVGFLGSLIGGFILFVLLLLLGMFFVKMARQTMLGNSLQVEYSDYAWLRDWANQAATDIGMPRVEIFVTQNPIMNAYAFGFSRPYCIVLHSGSIRYLSKEELKAIVIHEMAHIKYGHTTALVFLQPFISLPIVSIFTGWITGFWQRRAELTSDRLALMYMGDSELVKNALIKVHVGPDVADAMNQTARDWLQYNAERPMNRLAQTFSSHPFLVRRISHIDKYAAIATPAQPMTSATLPTQLTQ